MKKLTCIILAILCVAACFGACGEKQPPVTDGTSTPTVTDSGVATPTDVVTTEPAETTEGFNMHEDTFDGYTFKIIASGNLVSSKDANDFGGTEDDTELLEVKKYMRKLTVEELYDIGIDVSNQIKGGTASGGGVGFKAMQKSYSSGSYDYDFAMLGTYDVAQAAYNGFLFNIADLPYVDLQKDWWDQNALEQLAFGENVFFATGDIGILDNMVTHCVMFNKALVEEHNELNDPYEMVRNHTWTVDNFITEASKFGSDLNGDDKMDQYDAYGLMVWNDAAYSMLASAEVRVATMVDGKMELTLYNDRSIAIFDKYVPLVSSQNCFNYQSLPSAQWDPERVRMFNEDQILYSYCSLYTIPRHRDSETDFGILPFPKLDENQKNYSISVGVYSGMYAAVPLFVEDEERTGAIVEALAYHGKQILTPAYYEATLQGTYIRDEESGEMLDIMFANRFYDVGLIFKIGDLNSTVSEPIKTKANNFTSLYNRKKRAAENDIQKHNTVLTEKFGK